MIARCFGRASIAALMVAALLLGQSARAVENGVTDAQMQNWPSPEDYISWSVRTNATERYRITARYTGMKQNMGNVYTVGIAGQSLEGMVETTGKYLVIELGEVTVPRGLHKLTMKAE